MTSKIIRILIFSVFLMGLQVGKVNALSVEKNELTIGQGKSESIKLYANVSQKVTKVEFDLVYTTYDISASYKANSEFTNVVSNGSSYTITFDEALSGKIDLGELEIKVSNSPEVEQGTISIYNGIAITSTGWEIDLDSQNINVTVGSSTSKEQTVVATQDKNLLSKIESDIVTINLKKDVFDYEVTVDSDVEELDLKPIAKDDNYEIVSFSQKIAELTNNKIVITVKGNDVEQDYVIHVKQETKEEKTETQNTGNEVKSDYKSSWIKMIVILTIGLLVGVILVKKKI